MGLVAEGGERRYKLAEVSAESLDGWRAFAERFGTTPTALAEVLGHEFAALAAGDERRLGDALQRAVVAARSLASARRRRKRAP